MSIFAFICPYQLLTLKKVTLRQLFSRPGPYDPYMYVSTGAICRLYRIEAILK